MHARAAGRAAGVMGSGSGLMGSASCGDVMPARAVFRSARHDCSSAGDQCSPAHLDCSSARALCSSARAVGRALRGRCIRVRSPRIMLPPLAKRLLPDVNARRVIGRVMRGATGVQNAQRTSTTLFLILDKPTE